MKLLISKPLPGAQISWGDPIARGLVASWLFNEGTGDQIFDNSGNGNHGNLQNITPPNDWAVGRGGGSAIRFNYSDDYVDCGNDASVNITDAITLAVWFNSDVKDSSYRMLVRKNDAYTLHLGDNNKIEFYINDGGIWKGPASVPAADWNTGAWYHVVGTYDGSNLKIYLNGILKGTVSYIGDIDIGASVLRLGINNPSGPTYYFDGLIDEVNIWDRALSADEILRLYYNPYLLYA